MYGSKSHAVLIGVIAGLNLYGAFQVRDDAGKAIAFVILAAIFAAIALWMLRRSGR